MELRVARGRREIVVHLSGVDAHSTSPALIWLSGFERATVDAAAAAEAATRLTDALAEESGWVVVSFDYLEPFASGDPAVISSALDDIQSVVAAVTEVEGVSGVWLAGFAEGGALAICVAADEGTVKGVACLGGALELHPLGASPLDMITKVAPRPILVVHGAQDPEVPVADARAVVDAAAGHAELRILQEADHQIRNDPRTIAVLLGWMERQS